MKRTKCVAAVLGATVLALAGCSETGAESAGGSSGKFGFPSEIAANGELQVATHAAFPPLEYKNSAGEIVGAEIELMKEIGKRLGLRVQFTSVPFEQIISGLAGSRYDLAISDMSDTKERQQQVAKALQSMIDDGSYAALMKGHELSQIAITKVSINAGEK